MQVQNIIRASADVLTITHLTVGNVYKRVDTNYNGDASIKFGVVQSVMNNGTDAAITALEYEADYNGARATIRVITAAKDVAIFPARPPLRRSPCTWLSWRNAPWTPGTGPPRNSPGVKPNSRRSFACGPTSPKTGPGEHMGMALTRPRTTDAPWGLTHPAGPPGGVGSSTTGHPVRLFLGGSGRPGAHPQ